MDWFKLEEIKDEDIDNEIEEMNAQIEQEKAEKEKRPESVVGNEGENAALRRDENTSDGSVGNEGTITSNDNTQVENKTGDEETIEDLEREMEEEEQRRAEQEYERWVRNDSGK